MTHEGVMEVGKKYRGSLESALTQYVSDKLNNTESLDLDEPVFVTHSARTPEAAIEKVKNTIRETAGFKDIIECTASATISVHCGPGTLGILFFRK